MHQFMKMAGVISLTWLACTQGTDIVVPSNLNEDDEGLGGQTQPEPPADPCTDADEACAPDASAGAASDDTPRIHPAQPDAPEPDPIIPPVAPDYCSVVAWCDCSEGNACEPGHPLQLRCQQVACAEADAIAECQREVPVVCGAAPRPWGITNLNGELLEAR